MLLVEQKLNDNSINSCFIRNNVASPYFGDGTAGIIFVLATFNIQKQKYYLEKLVNIQLELSCKTDFFYGLPGILFVLRSLPQTNSSAKKIKQIYEILNTLKDKKEFFRGQYEKKNNNYFYNTFIGPYVTESISEHLF